MLLNVADMPTGYTISPPSSGNSSGDDFCKEAFAGLDVTRESKVKGPSAERDFMKGQPSLAGAALVVEDLGSDTEERLTQIFDKLPEAFGKCRTFSTTDKDGTKTSGTFDPLSFDKIGDQTFAMHMSGNTSSPQGFNYPFAGDLVFVREGSVAMIIFGFGLGALSVPITELEQIVKTGHAKLT
jgi:hypothetical protein